MVDEADDFTLVQRKKRGKVRAFRGKNHLGVDRKKVFVFGESSEEGHGTDTAAVQEKILQAEEELVISDFYRAFKDLLLKVLIHFKPVAVITDSRSTSYCNEANSPGDADRVSPQQTSNISAASTLDFYGNSSKKSCKMEQPECTNTQLKTTLCLMDAHCEREICICNKSSQIEKDKLTSLQSNKRLTKTGCHSIEEVTQDKKVIEVTGHASDEVIHSALQTVVCYGLGNFSDCVIARYQLALLVLMCGFLKIATARCDVYDPRFTKQEKQMLTNLGFNIILQNEEGKRVVSQPTLFFMPHCGKPLYNNLLWANWNTLRLSSIVIIGNSFHNIQERLPSRVLKDFSYLNHIMPFTREFPVKNNFQFADIFNDTSVHLLPIESLQEIPETVWDKHDKPMYDPDVESEIIPHQQNAGSL